MRKPVKYSLSACLVLAMSTQHSVAQNSLPVSRADSAMATQAKPLLILLSTGWCKFCQMQKSQLRKNKYFIRNSDSFYYVEFNAESTENIRFHGRDYHYKANGLSPGIHELAEALNGSNRVAFPTWVLLDSHYQVLFRYNGVLTSEQLNELMTAIDEINNKPLESTSLLQVACDAAKQQSPRLSPVALFCREDRPPKYEYK